MSGFEYTPMGMMPLGAPHAAQAEGAVAGGIVRAHPASAIVVAERPRAQSAAHRESGRPLKPADVIKMARCRLREVERDISRLRKLEKERDELRRLLAAADNKPRAVVRDISAAKRG